MRQFRRGNEAGGKSEKVANPEYAASYGGHNYDGNTIWMLPFRLADGYAGGPRLSPRNDALVNGSPCARCR